MKAMPGSDLVPYPLLRQAAERFRLLGEPVRLQLLNLLHARGEMTVQDLAEAAGQSHANASKHLRLMAEAGLVGARRDGPFVHYAIADPTLSALCILVCEQVRRREAEAA